MTLVAAIAVGDSTVVVADRCRRVGGSGEPTRDDTAKKLLTNPTSTLEIALVGDINLGSTRPEIAVTPWIPELQACGQPDRLEWLRSKVESHAKSASNVGILLLFDADDPGKVGTITIANGHSGAPSVTAASAALLTAAPNVWGAAQQWTAVSSQSWACSTETDAVAAAMQRDIATYAEQHSAGCVSKSTCSATIRAVQ